MNARRLLFSCVAALVALPLGASPARSAPARPVPVGAAQGAEPDETLTIIGEFVDGAVTMVVDPETGQREIVEDTRGQHPEAEQAEPGGAGGGSGPGIASDVRCTNANQFRYIAWGAAGVREARPWKAPEAVRFNPAHAPGNLSRAIWQAEILAGSGVWEDTVNPCGFTDTVGWITPTVGDDTTVELPNDPFNWFGGTRCSSTHNNSNEIGWQDMLPSGLVAATCVWSSAFGGKKWTEEGDIVFNTDYTFCAGPCSDYDLRATAAHEFGHYLGLGHSCGDADLPSCGPDQTAAVMYGIIIGHRTLSLGDIDGAETLYPAEVGYEITGIPTLTNGAPGQKLSPGHEYSVSVDLKNTGLRPWNVGAGPIALATRTDTASDWRASDWISDARAARVSSDLDNHSNNDARIPDNPATVTRDERGRFTFKLRIPYSVEGQLTAGEAFDLLADLGGGDVRFANGPVVQNTNLDIGTYASAFDDQLAVPAVVQGVETTEVTVDMKNTGTAPWFIGASEAITLGASNGTGSSRCSQFVGSDWLSCFTASRLDENVTATPLLPTSPSTSPVLPGQVGRFKFKFASPSDLALIGPHDETFDPKLAGDRWLGSPTTVTIVVL